MVHKNVSVISDTVSSAHSDDVNVESGKASAASFQAESAARVSETAVAARSITVQPGDTLSAIARKNGVSLASLCAANGLDSAAPIRVGQKLSIPAGGSAPAVGSAAKTAATYTVQPGDTLSRIAAKQGVSMSALMKANQLTPQQAKMIRVGQKLKLP